MFQKILGMVSAMVVRGPVFDIGKLRKHYPFKSNWWEHRGLRYHYLDEGEGEPLLMLHGNPTWSFYYRDLIKAFRETHRVIVLDHMGCGLSDRPTDDEYEYRYGRRIEDMEAFMEHLGLDSGVTFVGHDWGGIIGSGVAARNPDLFSRFVLFNTAGFRMPEGKKLPWQLGYVKHFPLLPALQIRGFNAFLRIATYVGLEKRMPREIRKAYLAPYNSWHNRIAILRFIQDIAIRPDEPSYDAIRITDENIHRIGGRPMLIIWGAKDFIFDLKILEEWKKRFPGAEVELYKDAGHFVVEDATDRIIERLHRFLSSHPLSELDGGQSDG
ncbi:MAG: alpha/beta fold hydrolase [Candidatus Thermoplasmatota archaeon]|nr:alpha/beta fold hydrolase [Candidatus Thermoplasmatota archaeon]